MAKGLGAPDRSALSEINCDLTLAAFHMYELRRQILGDYGHVRFPIGSLQEMPT